MTERPGQLRVVAADGTVQPPIEGLPEIFARDQGGFLDVVLADEFERSGTIFLSCSKAMGDGLSATAAARATLSDDRSRLENVEDVFKHDPPSPTPRHYGSRIVQDRESLVIAMGKHSSMAERIYAQYLEKTYGKVVRMGLDGSAPQDNPFTDQADAKREIWTLGHRNVQGAAMRPILANSGRSNMVRPVAMG